MRSSWLRLCTSILKYLISEGRTLLQVANKLLSEVVKRINTNEIILKFYNDALWHGFFPMIKRQIKLNRSCTLDLERRPQKTAMFVVWKSRCLSVTTVIESKLITVNICQSSLAYCGHSCQSQFSGHGWGILGTLLGHKVTWDSVEAQWGHASTLDMVGVPNIFINWRRSF